MSTHRWMDQDNVLYIHTCIYIHIHTHTQWNIVGMLSQSHVQFFVTPWTIALQDPLSMGFSRQDTGVGCHFLLQRIFPSQGSKPCLLRLLHWQADSLLLWHLGSPMKEWSNATFNNMDGPRDYYIKWSESDKDNYMMSLICGI